MQKQGVPWWGNRDTTWGSLQCADPFVISGLLAQVFINSPSWKKLCFTTGSVGANTTSALQPVITFGHLKHWFAHHAVPRKAAEILVSFYIFPYKCTTSPSRRL